MRVVNRESFLNNVTANLHRPRRTKGVKRPQWSVRPQHEVLAGLSQDELVDVLAKQCEVIHTDFKRTNRDGLAGVLKSVIEGYDGKAIIASSDSRNEDYGLNDVYQKIGRAHV